MYSRLAVVFAITAASAAAPGPGVAASATFGNGGSSLSRGLGHYGGAGAFRSGGHSGGLGLRPSSRYGDIGRPGFTGHPSSGWYQRGWGGTLNPGWGYNFGPNLGGSGR